MALKTNTPSQPFQDKYTNLYNQFLGQGQPKLFAYVNKYGGVSYGFEGITDPAETEEEASTVGGNADPMADEEENEINASDSLNKGLVGATGYDPNANVNGPGEGIAGDVQSGSPTGGGSVATDVGVAVAEATNATNSGVANAAGQAGIGDAATGGVSVSDTGSVGAPAGPSGNANETAFAKGGTVRTKMKGSSNACSGKHGCPTKGKGYAEGGEVQTDQGLLEKPMAEEMPPEQGQDTDMELQKLVGALMAGQLDKDSFIQEVVNMVEPPQAPPEQPPMNGPSKMDGLVAPPGMEMGMAKGGSYAGGGLVQPPAQQLQGAVQDPAQDQADTVDVPTDTGDGARLNHGEFVFNSVAARWIGHEKLLKMQQKAMEEASNGGPPIKDQNPANNAGLLNKPMVAPPQGAKPMQSTTGLVSAPEGLADRVGMIH